jgi:hypothetical protein
MGVVKGGRKDNSYYRLSSRYLEVKDGSTIHNNYFHMYSNLWPMAYKIHIWCVWCSTPVLQRSKYVSCGSVSYGICLVFDCSSNANCQQAEVNPFASAFSITYTSRQCDCLYWWNCGEILSYVKNRLFDVIYLNVLYLCCLLLVVTDNGLSFLLQWFSND